MNKLKIIFLSSLIISKVSLYAAEFRFEDIQEGVAGMYLEETLPSKDSFMRDLNAHVEKNKVFMLFPNFCSEMISSFNALAKDVQDAIIDQVFEYTVDVKIPYSLAKVISSSSRSEDLWSRIALDEDFSFATSISANADFSTIDHKLSQNFLMASLGTMSPDSVMKKQSEDFLREALSYFTSSEEFCLVLSYVLMYDLPEATLEARHFLQDSNNFSDSSEISMHILCILRLMSSPNTQNQDFAIQTAESLQEQSKKTGDKLLILSALSLHETSKAKAISEIQNVFDRNFQEIDQFLVFLPSECINALEPQILDVLSPLQHNYEFAQRLIDLDISFDNPKILETAKNLLSECISRNDLLKVDGLPLNKGDYMETLLNNPKTFLAGKELLLHIVSLKTVPWYKKNVFLRSFSCLPVSMQNEIGAHIWRSFKSEDILLEEFSGSFEELIDIQSEELKTEIRSFSLEKILSSETPWEEKEIFLEAMNSFSLEGQDQVIDYMVSSVDDGSLDALDFLSVFNEGVDILNEISKQKIEKISQKFQDRVAHCVLLFLNESTESQFEDGESCPASEQGRKRARISVQELILSPRVSWQEKQNLLYDVPSLSPEDQNKIVDYLFSSVKTGAITLGQFISSYECLMCIEDEDLKVKIQKFIEQFPLEKSESPEEILEEK